MGLFDKAKGLVGDNADKVKDGVDKAADLADEKTGGQHTDKIDTAQDKVNDVIDGLGDDKG